MSDEGLVPLHQVGGLEAIDHAFKEAETAHKAGAHCAELAMLRTTLDLWSSQFRLQDGKELWKPEAPLAAKLKALSEQNPIYRDTLHSLIDQLRIDTRNTLHRGFVCGRASGSPYPHAIHWDFATLFNQVFSFVHGTMPGLTMRRLPEPRDVIK